MDRRNLDWWCVRGILLLVLGMIVFATLAFGAVDEWAFLIVQGLAMGVFVLWAVRLWAHPKPRLLWPPLCWAVAAFTLYAVARYLTADIENVARQEVIQAVVFAFVFVAVVNCLYGQEEVAAVSFTLIALGTLVAGYAVVQLMHHSNQVWNEISPYTGRASGTFISPNNLAGLLAMLLPLTLAYLLVGKVSIVTRILLAYAALGIGAGLAVTFSRGGYAAAAAGTILLLVILLGHGNHRWKALILLLVMLVGGGFLVSHYLSKTLGYMQRVAHPDEKAGLTIANASMDSRLEIWRAAVRMWEDHPWWGVGPAHFDYRFPQYRPETLQARPDRVHNDYLNLLVDWGVVGGAIVLAGMIIFVVWLRTTWPHVRRKENDFGTGQSNRFAFFLGAMCGLAALAVHSAVDFNLHTPANALVGVTLLALVTSNARYATERYWFRARLPQKLTMTLSLTAVVACLGISGWRETGETIWLSRAWRQPNFSTERAAALEKAFRFEPENFWTAYEIGECYRIQSFSGGDNYIALGEKALDWYASSIKLNPYNTYAHLRTGMCLDWLGRHGDKAESAYRQAERLDPNGFFTVANLGWHYVQTGDYAAAQACFARSLKLEWQDNPIARNYLQICESKLAEQASGRPTLPVNY